ncbi:tetratricopeptide repeat protein [Candidatus Peregrinibacteria bacterium]|nr:tetratricopeptide repeat protein [Candidatus Peregrinibacteria bacterium]
MRFLRRFGDSLSAGQLAFASALLLLALGFLIYGRTLFYEFVELDDPLLILENSSVQSVSLAHLKKIFTTYDPELYIPLTFLSYQLDIAIGGLNPFLIHLHNLLQHILNAGLFGLLCSIILRNRRAALFAALLFLIHPIQVEAVVWATGRKDLMSSSFFLISLILYMRRKKIFLPGKLGDEIKPLAYISSLLSFLLGLFSKITVVSLPVVLLLIDWLEGRRLSRRSLLEKIPYFTLAIVFGIVALFGKINAPDLSVLTRILAAAKSFTFSITKLFVPAGLSPMYAYSGTISMRSSDFVLSLTIVTTIICAAYALRKRWKPFAFCTAFTMITFLPSFGNLIKNGDYYITSDRYAYIPSMGLFMLAGFLLSQAEKKSPALMRKMYAPAIAAFLLLLSLISYNQSSVWKNSETLSRHVTLVSPKARLGHLWYGNALRDAGRIDQAIEEYDVALSFKDDAQMHYDRALAYEEKGMDDEAAADYKQALTLSPRYALAHINLGRLFYRRGEKEDAQKHFESASELAPHLAMPLYNLGVLEGERGHFDRAAGLYRQALERDPEMHDARANLAIALLQLGKTAEAVVQLKETLGRSPDNATARALLRELVEKGIIIMTGR